MRRRSIHGNFLTGSVFKTQCHDCGMPTLDYDEFHPYEACEEFRRTQDSTKVEVLLDQLWDQHYGSVGAGARQGHSEGDAR